MFFLQARMAGERIDMKDVFEEDLVDDPFEDLFAPTDLSQGKPWEMIREGEDAPNSRRYPRYLSILCICGRKSIHVHINASS